MPKIYRYLTALLGVTGCVGLLVTGEINPVMAAGGLAIFPGYYRFLRGRDAAPGWVIGVTSLLTLAVFVFDSFVSGDVFLAVAHLTIAFQAIKSYDLKEPWDHLQVYFMSLLQMVIASEMSQSVIFGIVFILFLLTLVAAMVFAHFVKEAQGTRIRLVKPVAVISLLSLMTTSAFFVVLPRASYRFLGKSHMKGIKTTGFSDKVDFGSFGEIKLDPTVVMRVELDRALPSPYYWRGMSLDNFDGVEWRNTEPARGRIGRSGDEYILSPYERTGVVEQKIYLEAIDSDAIFGLEEIKGIRVDSFSAQTDSGGAVFLSHKSSRRVNYSIYSTVRDRYPGTGGPRYLQLPAGMSRIKELAGTVTSGDRTEAAKSLSIEHYLKTSYAYSLQSSPPKGGRGPIEEFLFYTKKGYCEHFATSMVLMLRSIGIPARAVNGYYGGEKNEYGGYIIVRQSDAHSWVEALIDGQWRRFDPTPAVAAPHFPSFALFLDSLKMAWARYVVGFKTDDQKAILRALYSPIASFTIPAARLRTMRVWLKVIPFLCVVVGGVLLLLRKIKIRRRGFVSGTYISLRNLMTGRGRRAAATTPGEVLRVSVKSGMEREIREFLRMYQEHRFGCKAMNPRERKKYALLLKRIRKGLKKKSGMANPVTEIR
jgi:transglutaminase-like putative cysteine protease